jgi:hypothetical protein
MTLAAVGGGAGGASWALAGGAAAHAAHAAKLAQHQAGNRPMDLARPA